MTSVFNTVFSDEELEYLTQLPEVSSAKTTLDSRPSGKVNFSIIVTESIHATLLSKLGLNLPVGSSVPMSWFKGDTAPHVDGGSSRIENTYLVYLTNSPGEFIVDSQSYPISANTGYVFNEGLRHETINTNTIPRLLLGPMSENGLAVGRYSISYFSSEDDAINDRYENLLGGSVSFLIGDMAFGGTGGHTSWRVSSNSFGPANQALVWSNGQTLPNDDPPVFNYYILYPATHCFLEGTTILCQVDGVETYVPIEQLKDGTPVKTCLDGFKKVVKIRKSVIKNPGNDERTENRLYKYSPSKFPALKEDLYITGGHSILEFPITEQQKETIIKHFGKLFATDKKYRIMAHIDGRAEPWKSEGEYTIYNFALEHCNEEMNYGVFANGGLLVETCCIKFLKNE